MYNIMYIILTCVYTYLHHDPLQKCHVPFNGLAFQRQFSSHMKRFFTSNDKFEVSSVNRWLTLPLGCPRWMMDYCSCGRENESFHFDHWIGLRENLQETHGFLPSNIGLKPVKIFPSSNSMIWGIEKLIIHRQNASSDEAENHDKVNAVRSPLNGVRAIQVWLLVCYSDFPAHGLWSSAISYKYIGYIIILMVSICGDIWDYWDYIYTIFTNLLYWLV